MNRWSTPKSSRFCRDKYISLDDDPYFSGMISKKNILHRSSNDQFYHSLDQLGRRNQQENGRDIHHSGEIYMNKREETLHRSRINNTDFCDKNFEPLKSTIDDREDFHCTTRANDMEARENSFHHRKHTCEARDSPQVHQRWSKYGDKQNINGHRVGSGVHVAGTHPELHQNTCAMMSTHRNYSNSNANLYSPPRVSRYAGALPLDEIYPCTKKEPVFSGGVYPTQKHHSYPPQTMPTQSYPDLSLAFRHHEHIGPKELNIHRLKLPPRLMDYLDIIVAGCENHTKKSRNGWHTELYSLTKQDVAIRNIPEVYKFAKPIIKYVSEMASIIYGIQGLVMDRNQPHVLKYEGHHRGVQLHHDNSDITVNLMLSRSNAYIDGGTYFEEANENVRLEFGEFLLHPGQCVHKGSDISGGTRYLMVMFADIK